MGQELTPSQRYCFSSRRSLLYRRTIPICRQTVSSSLPDTLKMLTRLECILKVSLALVPLNTPPGSQARQDDLIPRMLEFSSADDRIAVGRSSSGRSPVPSLFNALFHSRSVSRQHAELSVDPRTNVSLLECFPST